MKALARGTLDPGGTTVTVADVAAANRLHNKALAGTPQPGNTLRLTSVEAAHCVAQGWLEVPAPGPVAGAGTGGAPRLLGWADLVATGGPRAATEHLVYRDLRDRGLVARVPPGPPGRYDVLPRGATAGQAPDYHVAAHAAGDPVPVTDLLQGAATRLVAAVVDDDHAVTHYRMERADPRGSAAPQAVPAAPARAVAGRVLVTEPAAVAALRAQWLGTPLGDAQALSRLEAEHLRTAGQLRRDAEATGGRPDAASAPTPPPAVQATYDALRAAGLVVRSGFRFGTHLRAYDGAPDESHAPWLVQCAGPRDELAWETLARGVRLAHGVRKEFLVAVATGARVEFVRLSWFRP